MTPDATGTYEDAGEYGGKRYYQRNSDWFIWWDTVFMMWVISNTLGVRGASWWERAHPDIEGAYYRQGDAVGDATVTEI